MRAIITLALGISGIVVCGTATAAEPDTGVSVDAETSEAAPGPAPTPPVRKKGAYSLPWMLRPAIAGNVLRADAAIADWDGGTTLASTLLGGGKPFGAVPDLGLYARAALVHDAPDHSGSATALSNPIVFGLFTPELVPSLRLALFVGVTIPVGQGGGDDADPARLRAVRQGIYARQGMDNALFATNYLTTTGGVGVAWVKDGLTVQGEVTVLELLRVRGGANDPDAARTNFTSGVHVGYLIAGVLTPSIEAHYQRWLTTPALVTNEPTKRDQITAGVGLRANVPLSDTILMRPGVAYFHPIDDPMSAAEYRVIQLDLTVIF